MISTARVNLQGENNIVLAVRGGYGASRLLESIDWQGLAKRQQQDPLLICGHNDFTVIQLGLLALHNVVTFSGPMLAGNFGAPELDPFTVEHFWRALKNPTYSVEWQGNGPHWSCEGQLWGGNLAMLVSLIGTPWLPQIDGGILVLEDINEHPFRVERMLCSCITPVFWNVNPRLFLAVLPVPRQNDYDAGYSLETMVDFIRSRLDIPVITGLDFGHEQQTVTTALGAQATLKHDETGSRLTIGGHPVLKA